MTGGGFREVLDWLAFDTALETRRSCTLRKSVADIVRGLDGFFLLKEVPEALHFLSFTLASSAAVTPISAVDSTGLTIVAPFELLLCGLL
mmetsp:Transcript_16952/g.31206  ORF Transcript_16952/g.31206 Transcript_16952/m.31206 type:complete len:90 (+) Transcript_16952:239-508(+)